MNPLIHKVAVAVVAMMAAASAKTGVKFEIKNYETGFETGFERPYHAVISDRAAWDKLWEMHKGPPAMNGILNPDGVVPKVDFEKSNVLAVFLGQTANVEGFELVDFDSKNSKKVIVRLIPHQIRAASTLIYHPYALIETSKSELPVEIQIPAGNDQWKILSTLTPPKKEKSKETSSR